MREIHDRAVFAAHAAAQSCCETWASPIDADQGEALLRFILDHPTAPAESCYIKAGALGMHDGSPFAAQPLALQVGYTVFQRVLLLVSDALDAAEVEKRNAEALARIAAAGGATIDLATMTDEQLEGTPFERQPDPLSPTPGMTAALPVVVVPPLTDSDAERLKNMQQQEEATDEVQAAGSLEAAAAGQDDTGADAPVDAAAVPNGEDAESAAAPETVKRRDRKAVAA